MASGLASATTRVALADTPTETVIPAALRYTPPSDFTAFAGPGGFLHRYEGQSGFVWTKYSGGPDTPVSGLHNSSVGNSGAGADVVATVTGSGIHLQDMDSGVTTTIVPPAGHHYLGTFGSRVLTALSAADGTIASLHVLAVTGGQQTDTQVTGFPADAKFGTIVPAGDANAVVIRYSDSTGNRLALLDLAGAQATPVFGVVTAGAAAVLTDRYVGWYSISTPQPVLHLLSRSDLTAAETSLQVPLPPLPSTYTVGVRQLAIAGDSLLITYNVSHGGPMTTDDSLGYPLYSVPLAGGTLSTVLDHADMNSLRPEPNGAVAVGGSSLTDWAARQVVPGSDGTPAATAVDSDPAIPAPIDGLSLAGGQLFTIERGSDPFRNGFTRTIQLGATAPSYGDHTVFGETWVPSNCDTAAGCVPPIGTGDGRISQLWKNGNSDGDLVTVQQGSSGYYMTPYATGGTLVDSDGRYVVYDGGSTSKQYIGDIDSANKGWVLFSRAISGAALSGSTLWAADTTTGSISMVDLTTQRTVQTIHTGAPCVPSELQAAAGRWIYWSCGASGPAGVWDLASGQDISVPSSGPAELGDGFLVEHDTTAGKLELTDLHTDTAVSSDLASLPAGPIADDRRVTWAVDKYNGGIAYLDAQRNVHIVDPRIPASPALPAATRSLLPGERLTAGHSLSSANMTLVMQSDGNLVAYLKTGGTGTGPALWASGTYGHSGAYAVMQSDGDLVVYSSGGTVLWSTGTSGHSGAYAILQDDGNLVVYSSGGAALWSDGRYARSQTIGSGQKLWAGWWTQGKYTRLVMQPDGNLVMYRNSDGQAIWSSGTYGHSGAYTSMQSDGNLVVYKSGGGPGSGGALWASGTYRHSGAYAIMQNDGNLVVYSSGGGPGTGGALWATGTYKLVP